MTTIFRILTILQFICCIIFLYLAVTRGGMIFPFRIIMMVFISIDLLFGVYFLVCAHFLDKKCVSGDVDGCERNFTHGFVNFAASANLDLREMGASRAEHVEKALTKIERRTDVTVGILREFIEEGHIDKAGTVSRMIQDLFQRINFVEGDFEVLTNKKISKKKFYDLIKSMDIILEQIRINLSAIKMKKILDFYTKEAIFLNFLRAEKKNISLAVDAQLGGSKIKTTSENVKDCVDRKAKLCCMRDYADRLYFLLLVGSTAFLILLMF